MNTLTNSNKRLFEARLGRMISREIKDNNGTISNEKLCAYADPIHCENSENLKEYAKVLEEISGEEDKMSALENASTDNELIQIWLGNMLIEEINETRGAISNERLWSKASPIHEKNVVSLEEYVNALKEVYKKIMGEDAENAA